MYIIDGKRTYSTYYYIHIIKYNIETGIFKMARKINLGCFIDSRYYQSDIKNIVQN